MAKKLSKPKTSAQPVMLKTGMLLQPKGPITPGMARRWVFRSECSPIYGSLKPADTFRVVAVNGLGPNESTIGAAGSAGAVRAIIDIPNRPGSFVLLKQMNGSTQLKLAGTECRNYFAAKL